MDKVKNEIRFAYSGKKKEEKKERIEDNLENQIKRKSKGIDQRTRRRRN
jgi:hypothetical protein